MKEQSIVMSSSNLDEIIIFDDEHSESDMCKEIIKDKENEDAFHILDVGDIFKKHQIWTLKLPRIKPYYAMKCNPHPTIIKVLANLGANFDCASKGEIMQIIQSGVSPERIIFASPIKFPSHIYYAKQVGVRMMTVDTEAELEKIKPIYPEAKIVIRIRCDTEVTTAKLGEKFGCDPDHQAVKLIKSTINLGLDLHGFSFHAGSPCGEASAICRGIQFCKELIAVAKSLGCNNVKMIDIGGGIPGERDFILDMFSEPINDVLQNLDSTIQIIAEPGRYYVTSACISAANIIGKKSILKENVRSYSYYVSDGVYGSFMEELLDIKARLPVALENRCLESIVKYSSTIWGATCDSYDVIVRDVLLPEYSIGDWLLWYNMGSYSTSLSSNFNGIGLPKVYPVIRKNTWDDLWIAIENEHQIQNKI